MRAQSHPTLPGQGIYFLPTTFGPTTMVGLRAIGPYKNSGRTFQQVSALVKDHKLEDSLDFYAGASCAVCSWQACWLPPFFLRVAPAGMA